MDIFLHVIIFLSTTIGVFGSVKDSECVSPQYFQLGREGVVECKFPEGFYGVAWYDKDDFVSSGHSFLQFINGERNGEGYIYGEFDIYPNGSLIIKNVSLQHEHFFAVSIFESENDVPASFEIEVVVTVKPSTPFPVIDVCGESSNTCFKSLPTHFNLTCCLKNTRPKIPLSWFIRSSNEDKEIAFQYTFINNGHVSTSQVTTSSAFSHSIFLRLLVCKADSIPGILTEKETTIFIENNNLNFSSLIFDTKVIERGSELKLTCSGNNISMIVWKFSNQIHHDFTLLSYAALFANKVSMTYSDEYVLQSDGSLLVHRVGAKHEAFYGCISQNGTSSNTALFRVLVYVAAVPVVHGCTDEKDCVLNKSLEGSLTCSVTGVRPLVNLEWKTLNEKDSSLIVFYDHQIIFRNKSDVYDLVLTSTYQVLKPSDIIRAECRMTSSNISTLTSSAKFALFTQYAQTTDKSVPGAFIPLWTIPIIAAIFLISIILTCLCFLKGRREKRQNFKNTEEGEEEEMTPLNTNEEYLAGNKSRFCQELKTKYSIQYEAISPIPYIRDRMYCVNEIFVQGGFEKLVSNNYVGNGERWEKLTSDSSVCKAFKSSKRIIIESEPGYGKSTLALKLAYDWCKGRKDSFLPNVEILILLQLRRWKKEYSVFQAIKKLLLPLDSSLCENDIQNIMQKSKSTVIILDGYDEYPDAEIDSSCDIFNIIRRDMFQEKSVILTTRSSVIPEFYPPMTTRIRLTGFDEEKRNAYILKAVVKDSIFKQINVRRIERNIQDNPVLRGLCQVPLLFVMYAHMANESKRPLQIKSVTDFFRQMIACFYSHLKNKMQNGNTYIDAWNKSEKDILSEVAFNGLRRRENVWDKEYIFTQLGEKFYNLYRQLGVLVEEVLDEINNAGETVTRTEVRFFHQLFCEWYAAGCLSRKVIQKESNLAEVFQEIDPINFQYVYRFACGLNQEAAKVIIPHFKGVRNAEKFAILCSLEQDGDFQQSMTVLREFCSTYITIDTNDSELLQYSVLQLLEMGAANQVNNT